MRGSSSEYRGGRRDDGGRSRNDVGGNDGRGRHGCWGAEKPGYPDIVAEKVSG